MLSQCVALYSSLLVNSIYYSLFNTNIITQCYIDDIFIGKEELLLVIFSLFSHHSTDSMNPGWTTLIELLHISNMLISWHPVKEAG